MCLYVCMCVCMYIYMDGWIVLKNLEEMNVELEKDMYLFLFDGGYFN